MTTLDNSHDERHIRVVALHCATQLHATHDGKAPPHVVLRTAKQFIEWITTGHARRASR